MQGATRKEMSRKKTSVKEKHLQKDTHQRELYRAHNMFRTRRRCCMSCGKKFEPKRSDAKYCSAACRQRAYVKRDGEPSIPKPLRAGDIKHAIEIIFTTKPDSAFTIDQPAAGICFKTLTDQAEAPRHRCPASPRKRRQPFMDWDWRQRPLLPRFDLLESHQPHIDRHVSLKIHRTLQL